MYKNIIFDLGGVIVDFDPREYLMETFHSAKREELLYDLSFGSEAWKQCDAGLISRDAFERTLMANAKDADCEFEMQEIIDNWNRILYNHTSIIELAEKLNERGFDIYYLSNIAQDTLEMLQKRPFWKVFKGGVASCEVHTLKPEPAIYQAILEKYDLDPAECILIDDNRPNLDAASYAGITGIVSNDHGQKQYTKLVQSLNTCGIRIR